MPVCRKIFIYGRNIQLFGHLQIAHVFVNSEQRTINQADVHAAEQRDHVCLKLQFSPQNRGFFTNICVSRTPMIGNVQKTKKIRHFYCIYDNIYSGVIKYIYNLNMIKVELYRNSAKIYNGTFFLS